MAKINPGPFDRTSWLEWRRQGIGGSDAPAICGLDPRKGPLAIYLDKAGLLPLDARDESEEMRWGRLLESAIADEFETQRGLVIRGSQTMVEHETIRWLRATLDGFVLDDVTIDEGAERNIFDDALGILETKTASRRSSDWEDGPPDHVAVQVQHQLAVTGFDVAYVATLLMWPTPRLKTWEVERDQLAIDRLLEIEESFWQRVQDRDPPPADSYEETTAALRSAFTLGPPAQSIELSMEAMELVEQRRQADKLERQAKDRKQAAENGLMIYLGEHEFGTWYGKPLVRWSRYASRRFDVDGFRAANPQLADEFTRVTPARRMTFRAKSITEQPTTDDMGLEPEET